jgi:hypothetical protein
MTHREKSVHQLEREVATLYEYYEYYGKQMHTVQDSSKFIFLNLAGSIVSKYDKIQYSILLL